MDINTIQDSTKLLINGENAFPEIISCIRNAKKSVYINMFIWRDDSIGNTLAQEVLDAAGRGVKIFISKDTYGTVCEHAEEAGISFFHKKLSFADKIKTASLRIMYNPAIAKNVQDKKTELYESLMNHPNITVDCTRFKADHSKFYIFDDSILILGGINIEDKENGKDMSGRRYRDYMIKLEGNEYVELFKKIRNEGNKNVNLEELPLYFGMNVKEPEDSNGFFEMKNLYLDMIARCRKELTIVMAYFTPIKEIVKAIVDAHNRGVRIRIVIPGKANFQDDSNKSTVKKLMKKTKNGIKVYFSPDMLHTKLLCTENEISFGSCNITKKAFMQLDECNIFIKNKLEKLYQEGLQSVEKTIIEATEISSFKKISFNKFAATVESFLV